jgi:hypothetical protein
MDKYRIALTGEGVQLKVPEETVGGRRGGGKFAKEGEGASKRRRRTHEWRTNPGV